MYIFSGKRDTIVYPGVVKKLQAQYKSLGVPTNNIKTVYNIGAPLTPPCLRPHFSLGDQHGFPTLHYGNPCNYEGSPWLNNCSYDGAGDALAWLYGTLNFKGQAVPQNVRYFFIDLIFPTFFLFFIF